MDRSLDRLSVSDFRSLRGSITIPLTAPIILVHGSNGAGKTSIMSAIELGLTGQISALRGADPNFRAHLVNRDADVARVSLSIRNERPVESDFAIAAGKITGTPLLNAADSTFFRERCYLAQTTLSRLLEIYETADSGSDSPLTLFVKDLLGLDQLEALIRGLHPAGDIRRVRRIVPEYLSTQRAQDDATGQARAAEQVVTAQTDVAARLRASIQADAVRLGVEIAPGAEDSDSLDIMLLDPRDERRISELVGLRRQIDSARAALVSGIADQDGSTLERVEADERRTTQLAELWRDSVGQQLDALIAGLRAEFPDLPVVAASSPSIAFDAAQQRVAMELERCRGVIQADDDTLSALQTVEARLISAKARLGLIQEQLLGNSAQQSESLAAALAALLPHVHDSFCPVCGRDYAEIAPEPLSVRLSNLIAQYTEEAGRLTSLNESLIEADADQADAERQRALLSSRLLDQSAKVSWQERAVRLSSALSQLNQLHEAVTQGELLLRGQRDAQAAAAKVREGLRVLTDVSTTADDLARRLAATPRRAGESTSDLLSRLYDETMAALEVLDVRNATRERLRSQRNDLRQALNELSRAQNSLALAQRDIDLCRTWLTESERRRQSARRLSRIAEETRASIVSRVFNHSLNRIWRDLFVRLAPAEPYVPAFRLPESLHDPVATQLETVHRSGDRAGAPGTMLSAGNLNTAALTLFLALHLAAQPQLPWLLLDDPVQSMDELHIAQFAALLRTLSKDLGKQVMIAVHDRPLYEYLALELSPAFPGDQLVTIELSRAPDGRTIATSDVHPWQPDNVFAA